MEIHCDGAGYNGHISRICYYPLHLCPFVISSTTKFTNQETEYMAVIHAASFANKNSTIYTDSDLVYNHINENWKLRAQNLKTLCFTAKNLIKSKEIKLILVNRKNNLAGIYLEKNKHAL